MYRSRETWICPCREKPQYKSQPGIGLLLTKSAQTSLKQSTSDALKTSASKMVEGNEEQAMVGKESEKIASIIVEQSADKKVVYTTLSTYSTRLPVCTWQCDQVFEDG